MIQTVTLTPDEARDRILKGEAPEHLVVQGDLDLSNEMTLTHLPTGLQVRKLTLDGCSALAELPAGLQCAELHANNTALKSLPDDLQVTYLISLNDCVHLESLPDGLKTGRLNLHNCRALSRLPEHLNVFFLIISACVAMTSFPEQGPATLGLFNMRGCTRLHTLPPWLQTVAQLDISDCPAITQWPATLQVRSWLDLGNTSFTSLPAHLKRVRLRWHDVWITERIAFAPETISVEEILAEWNVELRRVLVERMGYETFLERCDAEVLDEDQDPGGQRQLLRVAIPGDEDLVALSVKCPSTSRSYMLRVPPAMKRCQQAAAWIAGFENPDDYQPLMET